MIAYTKTVNHELIASAKSALTDQKSGKAEHPAPLRAQEVAAGRWKGLKDKDNATEIIRSLEEQGRNIEFYGSPERLEINVTRQNGHLSQHLQRIC